MRACTLAGIACGAGCGTSFSSVLRSDGGDVLCTMPFGRAGSLPAEPARAPSMASGVVEPPGLPRPGLPGITRDGRGRGRNASARFAIGVPSSE